MFYISFCTDMQALRDTGLVDKDSPVRGMIDGRSGAHVCYSPDGKKSMIAITSVDGLEDIEALPFVVLSTPEEIHGFKRQVEIDGELQWTEEVVTVPAYTPQVVVGYTDGDPIYKVERVETPTIRTVLDEDGNTLELPGRPIVEYVTTDEIEGYKQVPVYGPKQEWVQVLVDTGEVNEFGDPILEDKGYYQDVVIPESSYTVKHPVLEEVAGDPALKALYDEIYPRTPTVDEEGNVHMPPKYFAIPGGTDSSHLL